MAGKTNELIKLSKDIAEDFDKRELDVLLSSGEQVTCSLLAGALIKLKIILIYLLWLDLELNQLTTQEL